MTRSICRIQTCTELVVGRNLCRKHYMRQWRTGSVTDRRKNARGICKVRGCDAPHAAKGLCDLHYRVVHRKRQRAAARGGRECKRCGGPIPRARNARAQFCSKQCKQDFHNARGQERHPERLRWYLIGRKYGITSQDFEALLLWQGGRCAICFTDDPQGRGTWHIDHDHGDDRIRGLLCNNCNVGLGRFRDDSDLLRAALAYLEGYAVDAVHDPE